MLLVEQIGYSDAAVVAVLAGPPSQIPLGKIRATKHVEHPGRRGHAVNPERPVNPPPELVLAEELLERPRGGEDPVPMWTSAHPVGIPDETRGDDEDGLGETPSGAQSVGPFDGVFDDVDHVAEVHHVGVQAGGVRPVRRIPTSRRNPQGGELTQIVASSAAVVEHSRVSADQAVFERERHWPRQEAAAHGRTVAGDRCRHAPIVPAEGRPMLGPANPRERVQAADVSWNLTVSGRGEP